MSVLLLFLALLLPPAPPTLTAHWTGPHSIELRWDTPGCLYRKPAIGRGVFLGCHAAGAMRLPPDPPADAAYFPRAGDRYLLVTSAGDVWAALSWAVWLPVAENRKAPPVLVLLAPERVALGHEFRVSAVISGNGSYDIALGMGNPAGFSTHDDLICSRRVEIGRPATCSWWIRAETAGAHTIAVHVADAPAVRAVVRVGWAVWLPLVGR